MEKLDFWKKYPSYLVGSEPMKKYFPKECHLQLSDLNSHNTDFKNSYFFVWANENNIEKLRSLGASHTQIFVLGNYPHPNDVCEEQCISVFEDESPEEFRARLLQRLELHRQKTLHRELKALKKINDPTKHQRALDRAHLAHSLAFTLRLSSQEHISCIQLAYAYEEKNEMRWNEGQLHEPWPADHSYQLMLVDICELALRNHQSANFRASYRLASAQLGFKFRSDLIKAVEICFQHIWGDTSHVA